MKEQPAESYSGSSAGRGGSQLKVALKIGEHTLCIEGCFAIDDALIRLAQAWMSSLGVELTQADAEKLANATATLKRQGDLKDATLAAHPADPAPA